MSAGWAGKDDSVTKSTIRTATTGLLLLVATACSVSPGSPGPASSGGAPASPSSTGPKVPQVSNPLDATKYEQDPCSVLTEAQAGGVFGAVRKREAGGTVAPLCTWNDRDNSGISVGFLPRQGGLATTYENSVNAGAGYFEAAPEVAGYPAAFSAVHDDRKTGGCQIAVGVTNDEVFTVSSLLRQSSPHYNDPCALVTKVAEAAVTTLKAGA
ncbi:DUF3558 domain-containing protein [Amycolatopsis panacis]|uniref:DUF3558 domain-containing protein n=1 Tax=Amycolatopsis panacis TaxID=2340917 RepID=A0A419I2F8_9PSEU|nr:DUF3558 domain-containing protein [Amycolatopsis panacis]RJQ84087.1 DUF3558 domain-containing protein [Amycolatopsis panacis]